MKISLNQIKGFEAVNMAIFRARLQKEQAEQRRWFAGRLELMSAIQRQLQKELTWSWRGSR